MIRESWVTSEGTVAMMGEAPIARVALAESGGETWSEGVGSKGKERGRGTIGDDDVGAVRGVSS